MSNPKFAVGDKVALCRLSPLLAIPSTTITAIYWIRRGDRLTDLDGVKFVWRGRKTAMYAVAGSDQIHGEGLLRHLNPGDYTESTQEVHKVSGVNP